MSVLGWLIVVLVLVVVVAVAFVVLRRRSRVGGVIATGKAATRRSRRGSGSGTPGNG